MYDQVRNEGDAQGPGGNARPKVVRPERQRQKPVSDEAQLPYDNAGCSHWDSVLADVPEDGEARIAPAGELKSRAFLPQGERLKHFPGDSCKALRK